MSRTRHMQARMTERAISAQLSDLTLEFGVPRPDGKVVLNKKALADLRAKLRKLTHVVDRADQRGGLVVVEQGDLLLTTYALNSYRRYRRRRRFQTQVA